jgi:5'-3' exonuclease
MKKILIVDSTNNFLRCYAAIPTQTVNGEPNGGIYGFLTSLYSFIKQVKPDKVILCWDGIGGSKKRRAIVKEYKDGRKPVRLNRNFEHELENTEKNKSWQRYRLSQFLNDLPVSQITINDIEADDVIAYLTKKYSEDRKIIVSSDKDFYQLLDEKTVIYNASKKNFINNKTVVEKFNIHPVNFALARAIIGDKSDNLVGIFGVGLKTVVKYFPFLTDNKKIEIEELFSFCQNGGDKYSKFLDKRTLIEDNLKVMRLDTILIGNSSTNEICTQLERPLCLNATSFRMKLVEDGIHSITDNYLQGFKIFMSQGTTDGNEI